MFSASWNYFGYDEANYTNTPNGRKLLSELAALDRDRPAHIRTHFLLATGDGTPGLKWSSTNAYREDTNGKPIYDWTITDRILGAYVHSGLTPFVEVGFMPEALSAHPKPYTPAWKPHGKAEDYFIGWTYPPSDYNKWSELVYQWVSHSISKFGSAEISKWDWEVWNEPDIAYWHGTPDEYDKLYDYTVAAIKRASPRARVGGPASTGPANPRAAAFLRQFLEHCESGHNFATGKMGAPLDFISFHAKGKPQVVSSDHVRMGLEQEMQDATEGFAIVRSFPRFAALPIVLSEADPEGCAACSARVYPQNAYRNGTLYPAYEAAAFKRLLESADRDRIHLAGVLTWAFEFEDQPYFDGFRTLATNGVDKPVLNFFRMLGRMKGTCIAVSSHAADRATGNHAEVDALAARSDRSVTVLVWNYGDDEQSTSPADVAVAINELADDARRRLQMRHYRIDETHSNAFTAWQQIGSPQRPTPAQFAALERAGQLQMLDPAQTQHVDAKGTIELRFTLPRESVSLLELSW